jgi:phosphoglycolate phosphatase
MNFEKIENIIWDWNGTLLNDVEICIRSMNVVLEKRKLTLLNIESYREVFTFPVKDYYGELGFDFEKEAFEIPAMEFIDEFTRNLPLAPLHEHAPLVLEYFKSKGYRQFVLSAMEQDALLKSVSMKGILEFFTEVKGIHDHYARGKEHIAHALIDDHKMDISRTLLIGDTLHDMEVAKITGIHCILVSSGHQSPHRIEVPGIHILNDLNELENLF